jgi:hypothetical protein
MFANNQTYEAKHNSEGEQLMETQVEDLRRRCTQAVRRGGRL